MDLLSAKEEKANRHANEGSWVLREAIARRVQLLITFTAFLQSAGQQLGKEMVIRCPLLQRK